MSTISVTSINDGDAVTAASINNQVNTIVNDYNGNITNSNIAAGAAIAQSKLSLSLTGASDNIVAASESSATQTYADLGTVGPSVTVTVGSSGVVLINLSCGSSNNGTGSQSFMAFVASGANTIAATDNKCIRVTSSVANAYYQVGINFLLTGLSAGSTTFKAQYRTNGSTSTWVFRELSAIPL